MTPRGGSPQLTFRQGALAPKLRDRAGTTDDAQTPAQVAQRDLTRYYALLDEGVKEVRYVFRGLQGWFWSRMAKELASSKGDMQTLVTPLTLSPIALTALRDALEQLAVHEVELGEDEAARALGLIR